MTVWLTRELVLAIHEEQLAEHGGTPGLRDEGLLESALARPLNYAGYSEADLAVLAALYALGIAKSHPFLDGNKRAAYVVLEVFLELNGLGFNASDADAVIKALQMAAGDISDDEFIAWVRSHAELGVARQTTDKPTSSA